MPVIAIMKAQSNVEKRSLTGQNLQQPQQPSSSISSLSEQEQLPREQARMPKQIKTQLSPIFVLPPQPTNARPRLTISSTAAATAVHANTSESSSPASSISSSSASLASQEPVSFSFFSPLFYDQKLRIYYLLLELYRWLGRSIEQHPVVLLLLQYSFATIHGLTVYILSVILSVAQLIMITATLESLDWIQAYKPLMCEWNHRFPGFVFPALDIDSESEDDCTESLILDSRGCKGTRYWKAQATLKKGDDIVDDEFYSEGRMTLKYSMNSTLRRRLIKYQQWMPSFWTTDEGRIQDEQTQEDGEDSISEDAQDHYSSRLSRAFVRTLSGGIKPAKSKRVTFNEQVLIFGRRRSSTASQVSSTMISSMTPLATESAGYTATCQDPRSSENRPAKDAHISSNSIIKDSRASPVTNSKSTAPLKSSIEQDALAAMTHQEEEYQRSIEDVNGSGTLSPLLKPVPQKTPSLPNSTHFPPTTAVSTVSSASPGTISADPEASTLAKDTHELRRSASVPMKIGSFLHRHHRNNGAPQQNTVRHSATFSESGTVSQNPRALPAHLTSQTETNSSMLTPEAITPTQESKSDNTASPRSSLSLGTRAKRSLSLVLPGLNSNIGNVDDDNTNANIAIVDGNNDNAALDHQGPIDKKNFMYRIVHPRRYKRRLGQQVTEQGQQRLLALAQLQRKHIFCEDDAASPPAISVSESPAIANNTSPVLCGDAYYYATSAEYVEGIGAPNSVISTSVGISFPQELQRNISPKNWLKQQQQRPVSFEYGRRSEPVCNLGLSYGFENDTSSDRMMNDATEKSRLSPRQRFLFKRESNRIDSNASKERTLSSNRLQQLFSHSRQKEPQSPSSLLYSSGDPPSSEVTALTPLELNKCCTALPVHATSSSAGTGVQRLLPYTRSNSQAFTSFKAVGTPAKPPAQLSISSDVICPVAGSTRLAGQGSEMEHTTFAAFGFPSPTQSPDNSAPASPRHSMSSMPTDAPSRIQAMSEHHSSAVHQQLFSQLHECHYQDQQHQKLESQHDDSLASGSNGEDTLSMTSSSDGAVKPSRRSRLMRKLKRK
ncbi:hypothetical protein BG011_009091 [Mortierella polycephala]|uniref:Uncharacterized protein n=1 Tax=Mortierella polycephala TaxID=41804 RepID=A0A9P6Q981_9FUNG|nr:hypothetical protein BG011_009091 [Mortierella polycephala]